VSCDYVAYLYHEMTVLCPFVTRFTTPWRIVSFPICTIFYIALTNVYVSLLLLQFYHLSRYLFLVNIIYSLKTHPTLTRNRRRDTIVGIELGYGLKVWGIMVRFRTEAWDLFAISIFIWGPHTSCSVRYWGSVLLAVKRPEHDADHRCSL
jgi:hypothetical protein